jgi:hypothetical protein
MLYAEETPSSCAVRVGADPSSALGRSFSWRTARHAPTGAWRSSRAHSSKHPSCKPRGRRRERGNHPYPAAAIGAVRGGQDRVGGGELGVPGSSPPPRPAPPLKGAGAAQPVCCPGQTGTNTGHAAASRSSPLLLGPAGHGACERGGTARWCRPAPWSWSAAARARVWGRCASAAWWVKPRAWGSRPVSSRRASRCLGRGLRTVGHGRSMRVTRRSPVL